MAGEIVLGYDGSACADAALDEAAALARALGTRVVIAYGYGVWVVGGEIGDQQRIIQGIGEAAAQRAVERLAAAGVEAEAAVVPERPWAAILEVAASREARLIVVGSRGEGPVVGALLGSVPYKLLPQATIPVLVVPGPAGP